MNDFKVDEEYTWIPLTPFVDAAYEKWIDDEKTKQTFGFFYINDIKLQHTPKELYKEIIEESYKYEVSRLDIEVVIEKDITEGSRKENETNKFGFRCLVNTSPNIKDLRFANLYANLGIKPSISQLRGSFIKLNNTNHSPKTSQSENSDVLLSFPNIRYTKRYMVESLGEPELINAPRNYVENLFKLFSENE